MRIFLRKPTYILPLAMIGCMVVTSGCSKKKTECCVVVSLDMSLKVKSAAGDDLLDPATPDALTTDSIDLYYLEGTNYKKVYYPNQDAPKNIIISELPGGTGYAMKLFVNPELQGDISTTLVKFGYRSPDTIRATIQQKGASSVLTDASINGEHISDLTTPYELVK